MAQRLDRSTLSISAPEWDGAEFTDSNAQKVWLMLPRELQAIALAPTQVLLYVYALSEPDARVIAQSGADPTLSVEVEPSASNDGTWLCMFQGTLVPEIDTIREYGRRFQALATQCGGEYDGWEAAVVK